MATGKGITERLLRKHVDALDVEYRAARVQDAQRLYEALHAAILAIRPQVEVLVYVLDFLRHQAITDKLEAGQEVKDGDNPEEDTA